MRPSWGTQRVNQPTPGSDMQAATRGVFRNPDSSKNLTEPQACVRARRYCADHRRVEDDALGARDAIMTAYIRHRELIQDITERKYRPWLFETGRNVVIRHEEVTTAAMLRRTAS
jgi:hypothetical protein